MLLQNYLLLTKCYLWYYHIRKYVYLYKWLICMLALIIVPIKKHLYLYFKLFSLYMAELWHLNKKAERYNNIHYIFGYWGSVQLSLVRTLPHFFSKEVLGTRSSFFIKSSSNTPTVIEEVVSFEKWISF